MTNPRRPSKPVLSACRRRSERALHQPRLVDGIDAALDATATALLDEAAEALESEETDAKTVAARAVNALTAAQADADALLSPLGLRATGPVVSAADLASTPKGG